MWDEGMAGEGDEVLKALQQFADRVVITRRNEGESAFLGTKDQPNVQASATFEIVSAKAPNAQA
jgi:hypothetical protein